MKHSYILFFLTSLVCILSQTVSARNCRILFLDRPNDAPKSLHLFDGTSSQEVDLPSMNFSPVYKLPEGAIKLRLLTEKYQDPTSVSPDAPFVEIPETYVDFYLIISSDPENKITPVSIKAYCPSDETFKAGQTLWINLTEQTIHGTLGEAKLILKPNSTQILNAPINASGYYKAEFSYQTEANADLQKITEQSWWHDANSKHLGFVINAGGKLPKIFFYRDFRTPEAP